MAEMSASSDCSQGGIMLRQPYREEYRRQSGRFGWGFQCLHTSKSAYSTAGLQTAGVVLQPDACEQTSALQGGAQ